MTYEQYLESKKERVAQSGFSISDDELNPQLFPFQKFCVKRALAQGKYALFQLYEKEKFNSMETEIELVIKK